MTRVYVDVDLDEFDDHELLRECERRELIPAPNPVESAEDFSRAIEELMSRRYSEALIYLERAMPCINGICHALHIVH